MSSSRQSQRKKIPSYLIILTLVAMFAAIIYFSGILFFSGLLPCNPPPWVSVDGVAKASVYAFYDDNRNGLPDEGERSLPNVEVRLETESARTDDDGEATVYLFKAGCICRCSRGETMQVILPQGWQSTTPLEYLLKGKEEVFPLGFFR